MVNSGGIPSDMILNTFPHPILVLDEATAMFDPEGEKSFIEECHDILHKRTVILITHRPASLALADRVLELKDGKIASI